jgi:ribonuclease HI
MNNITVFFDGACEPVNPGGVASYGFIVHKNEVEVYRESKIVAEGKDSSNNVAEYNGLLNALRWLYKNGHQDDNVVCKGDSRLVVEQINGRWQMNKGIYIPWAIKCREAVKYFTNISFEWVPRTENIADDVSKDCLRRRGVKFRIQPEGGR